MIAKSGLPITLHKTLNRREALTGADFVTTQLRVGLLKAREKDERIPLSHGLLGQETNGAGGLFKGLLTIPIIFDIIKDVEENFPDAWIINFTNPAGMVTEAVARHTNFKKFIGVCNVLIGMKMFVQKSAFFKVVVVFYAARRSFSGLSATILTGVQSLVFPDQRSGCWHRAAS